MHLCMPSPRGLADDNARRLCSRIALGPLATKQGIVRTGIFNPWPLRHVNAASPGTALSQATLPTTLPASDHVIYKRACNLPFCFFSSSTGQPKSKRGPARAANFETRLRLSPCSRLFHNLLVKKWAMNGCSCSRQRSPCRADAAGVNGSALTPKK